MQTNERRLSRRNVLLAGAALPIPVFLQERPAMLDDADLLAAVARFHAAYAKVAAARKAREDEEARLAAHRDCPVTRAEGLIVTDEDRQANAARFWWIHNRRDPALWDAINVEGETVRAAVRTVFELPAHTLPGVLAKLRIVYLAYGWGEGGSHDGDDDLRTDQYGYKHEDREEEDRDYSRAEDEDVCFLELVLADLERLAGSAQT